MCIQFPTNLTFANSALRISFEKGANLNRTKDSILIEGTRGGFLSLSNALSYALNDLEDKIDLHLIPYVASDISFSIVCDESLEGVDYGKIFLRGDSDFIWKMSESEVCNIAGQIHSLGHINPELHFDSGKPNEEITVYCVVNDECPVSIK